MERSFTRATGSSLQPVEIGKRLVRVMESQQSVGIEGVIVPNVYDVYLSDSDFAHFQQAQSSLTRNMESHLARTARQRRYQLVSRPVVRLHLGPELDPGDIRIDAHLQDLGPEEEYQHTGVLPRVDSAIETAPVAPSIVWARQKYAVLRSPTKVGRLPDNDIVLNDRRVSRYHAEVLLRGKRWLVRDVGSTNGTAVNGKLVKEAPLTPGDTVSLGGLEVRWEQ